MVVELVGAGLAIRHFRPTIRPAHPREHPARLHNKQERHDRKIAPQPAELARPWLVASSPGGAP